MKISVEDLRSATEKLLANLEATGHGEVEIDADFYWDVPANGRYDSYEEPKLSVGQLSSDIEEVQKIARGESVPVNLALVWLAAVLRRIGESSPG